MAIVADCIITASVEGRGAYGVRIDSDESVYFSVQLSELLELEEFEQVQAVLVKNQHPNIPWRAIRARRPDELMEA